MNLVETLKAIGSKLSKPLSDIKFKTISEESIRAQIEDAKWALTVADEAFGKLSDKEFDQLYIKVKNRLKFEPAVVKAIGHTTADFINNIDKNLKGKARGLGFHKASAATTKNLLSVLDGLQANVDTILDGKEGIVITDFRITHCIFFGAIESINIYSSMNSYLLAIFSHVLSMGQAGDTTTPKYMCEYLVKHKDTYMDLVDQMCNAGSDKLISKISGIKQQGLDLAVGNTKSGVVLETAAIMTAIKAFVAAYGIFIYLTVFVMFILAIPMIGEAYIDRRHYHYEQLKERKKWLESHSANIKLALEGVNENDPEFVKNRKIVDFYDDEIAKLDKRILDYYNE